MKTQRAVLPLALLSAAFLLGCQEQAVGPDTEIIGPNFDPFPHAPPGHGGDGVEATFTATWTDPSDLPFCDGSVPPCGADITNLHEGNKFLGDVGGYTLDLRFLQTAVTNGAECFADGTFTGTFQLHRLAGKPQNARVLFSFPAKGTGNTDVDYALLLFGVAPNDFLLPATSGQSIVINWENFDVDHENGPGRKAACSGSTGDPNSAMLVTNTTRE